MAAQLHAWHESAMVRLKISHLPPTISAARRCRLHGLRKMVAKAAAEEGGSVGAGG